MGFEFAPQHVAIIPDGNRRYAQKHGLAAVKGHLKGYEGARSILDKALECNVKYITYWGASISNLTKRSRIEVEGLYKVFFQVFSSILEDKELEEKQVRIRVLGKWEEYFPERVKELIRKAVDKTQNFSGYHLTFLLGYNGDVEMMEAIQSIVDNSEEGVQITPELIKKHLYTHDLPSVDLVIRTGSKSDPHNSVGFMMWDTANAQFHFTSSLYPEFTPQEFQSVIEDFSQREKRQGK